MEFLIAPEALLTLSPCGWRAEINENGLEGKEHGLFLPLLVNTHGLMFGNSGQ